MNLSKFILIIFLSFFITQGAKSQLVVNNAFPYNSASYLVQNVLLGVGITVSNVTYNGAPVAIGYFNGINSNIGLDSGIVMTSGDILNAVGPNNTGGSTGSNNLGGDPDLDLVSSSTSQDAAVLEFDFVPVSDSVKFRFVFGSEEYLEYVGSFNDVFAFFISGPGIAGPYSNGAENIALIPGTTTPVSINNVNDATNSQYYFDNGNGSGSGSAPDGLTVQYDGFTKVLVAKRKVTPCQKYHIKIAVADALDHILDSGVFLEAGSFNGGNVSIVASAFTPDSTAIEGCSPVVVNFCIPAPTDYDYTIHFNVTGTATNGTDYVLIPDSVVIPVGQKCAFVTINPINDGMVESIETLILNLNQLSACDTLYPDSVNIRIKDFVPLSLTTSNDTSICIGQSMDISATATGGFGLYQYNWDNGAGSGSAVNVIPDTTTTYKINVIDSCGNQQNDSVKVVVTQFPVADFAAPDSACSFENVTILFTGVGSTIALYNWIFDGGTIISGSGQGPYVVSWSTLGAKTIILSVDEAGCKSSPDTLSIFVKGCEVFPPNIFTPNGDDNNDKFVILNLQEHQNSALKVYNRWGRKVYESKNYQNDWDGLDVSDGVYYYVLKLTDGTDKHGTVTIIKNK